MGRGLLAEGTIHRSVFYWLGVLSSCANGAPIHKRKLWDILQNNGKVEDSDKGRERVDQYLSHLRQYGFVVSVGNGHWKLTGKKP